MADQSPIHQGMIPYLTVDDPAAAIDFYARAFGASEVLRLKMGDKVGHAEMNIGGSRMMLSGEWPQMGILSPKSRGGATASFSIYVADADAAYAHAIESGATPERPPSDQFYGDRMGSVIDPFGHRWSLHTPKEQVPEREMQARMDAVMASMGSGGQTGAGTSSGTEAEVEAHPS